MTMLLRSLVLSLALSTCACQTKDAPRSVSDPKRVLVYTVSAGFEHDVVRRASADELSLVERTMVALGQSSGMFTAVPTRSAADFTAENLATFDAVLFYTTGELSLSSAERRALLDFVRAGRGFVGVHSATDTLYELPEYGEMIGAYFDGHPWHERVRVMVEDATDPSTRHLGTSFTIEDEIYQFRAPYDRAQLHVLLRLDADAVDTRKDGVHRTDRDFAIAWRKDFGAGRVFYTSLGHRPEVWADERFRRHLVGGVLWAAGAATR
ncbi:MAG: ThuA domain-containing protein [Planctomycetota bacterium]